jgi:hypothetical protein
MNQITSVRQVPAPFQFGQRVRAIGALVLGVAAGAALTFVLQAQVRPTVASPAFAQPVTDGWARSSITRAGGLGAFSTAHHATLTDGWLNSPITRAGGQHGGTGNETTSTDGWMLSPITRAGGVDAFSDQ